MNEAEQRIKARMLGRDRFREMADLSIESLDGPGREGFWREALAMSASVVGDKADINEPMSEAESGLMDLDKVGYDWPAARAFAGITHEPEQDARLAPNFRNVSWVKSGATHANPRVGKFSLWIKKES